MNRIYQLKTQNPKASPVLVEITSFKIQLQGPKGVVCVPVKFLVSQEEALVPVSMIMEVIENTNEIKKEQALKKNLDNPLKV